MLLSGGDPLLLSDKKLEHLISRLREIQHVEFIRIGSRIPVFLPQRITPELCEIFKKYGPVWMSIHVNHPGNAPPSSRPRASACPLPACRWETRACSSGR